MSKKGVFKNPMPDKSPSKIDWARLAAFIDGEGCIRISERKMPHWKRAYYFLQINVSNTDPRLIVWLKETFGGGAYERKHNQKNLRAKYWANCFSWIVSCKSAQLILEGCLPYFIIKRDQAELALAFQKTINEWGGKGQPRQKTSPELVEYQFQLKIALQEMKGRSSRREGFRERNKTMEQIVAPEGLIDSLVN